MQRSKYSAGLGGLHVYQDCMPIRCLAQQFGAWTVFNSGYGVCLGAVNGLQGLLHTQSGPPPCFARRSINPARALAERCDRHVHRLWCPVITNDLTCAAMFGEFTCKRRPRSRSRSSPTFHRVSSPPVNFEQVKAKLGVLSRNLVHPSVGFAAAPWLLSSWLVPCSCNSHLDPGKVAPVFRRVVHIPVLPIRKAPSLSPSTRLPITGFTPLQHHTFSSTHTRTFRPPCGDYLLLTAKST